MEINTEAYLVALQQKQETPYTICKDIAACIHLPVGRVLGMTRSWSMHQLVKSRDYARKHKNEWWKYREAINGMAKSQSLG